MRARPSVVGAFLLMATLGGAAPALAQTAADLFDLTTLQEIRLTVNSRDLRQLRETFLLNTHYTADLQWRGIKVRNASLRSRGTGSRSANKPGLLVEFDRYTTGQKFLGLSAIVLRNGWEDRSLIRNTLAFWTFAQMGLTAPRESFCKLFINNEYQGVYTITEQVDGDYVTRVTGETDGTLFEYHHVFVWNGEDLGNIKAYKPLFEARTHELDSDSTLYVPIQQLFKEVNGPDDAVWRERVEQYIDLDEFVRHVAVETFIAENDGITGFAGMNNFYLYRFAGTQKHRLFPWDKDNAYIFLDSPVAPPESNILFRRAMTFPDLKELYFQTLEGCARLVATDNAMANLIDQVVSVIDEAVRTDTRKQFSNDEYDADLQFLRDFVARRPTQVLNDVAQMRAQGAGSL
jgi:spore coat protein CotH